MTKPGHDGEFSRYENAHMGLLGDMLEQLQQLNEGVKRLATSEQIAKLEDVVTRLEGTVTDESGAIHTEIEALEARIAELTAQGGTDPALDALTTRLVALRNTIAGTVAGGAEPDAPEAPAAPAEPAATPPEEPAP